MNAPKNLLSLFSLILAVTWFAPAVAGPIEAAVAGMDDGRVRLSYPVREGVSGDGQHLNFHRDDEHSWSSDCETGPARVELRVRDGELVDLKLRVGGQWRTPPEGTVDLGELEAAVATDYFLTLAETGSGEPAEDAILAAMVADGPEPWERLLVLARNRQRPDDVREQAIFWLGVAAGEKATEGIADIAHDDDEDLEVREQAVFALSQIESPAALEKLMDIARGHGDPEIREKALFWLAQRDEPEVIDLFEEILLGE